MIEVIASHSTTPGVSASADWLRCVRSLPDKVDLAPSIAERQTFTSWPTCRFRRSRTQRARCSSPRADQDAPAARNKCLVADSTQEVVQIAAVLVVGGSPALIKAVHEGAGELQGTEVVTCAVREAPTRAAELRPFAIVMSEDVYAFDSKEFDALARDVRAEIVTFASDARRGLDSADGLAVRIAKAFDRRRRRTSRRPGRRRSKRPSKGQR